MPELSTLGVTIAELVEPHLNIPAPGGGSARNMFLTPPDVPNPLDDEFDEAVNPVADLAARGWVARSLSTGALMTRIGDVQPTLAVAGALGQNDYRSTIFGSVLYLQCRGMMLYKPLSDVSSQRIAARMWPSIIDPVQGWSLAGQGDSFLAASLYQAIPDTWPFNGLRICCTALHLQNSDYARYRYILNDTGYRYNLDSAGVDRNTRGDLLMVGSKLTDGGQHEHAVVDALAQRVMRVSPGITVGVAGATGYAAGGIQTGFDGGTPNPNYGYAHWTCIDYIRFRPFGSFFPR